MDEKCKVLGCKYNVLNAEKNVIIIKYSYLFWNHITLLK